MITITELNNQFMLENRYIVINKQVVRLLREKNRWVTIDKCNFIKHRIDIRNLTQYQMQVLKKV